MAIIPKGRFLDKKPDSVARPQLPSDGSAKPYQALAQMGDTMAKIGGEMYRRERAEEVLNQTSKAKTEYATRAALTSNQLKNEIDDEGKVLGRTYADVYTEEDQSIIDDISGNISDPKARTAFRQQVEGASRSNRVSSINTQTKHRNERFKVNFKNDTTQEAGSIALDAENVNQTAFTAYSDKKRALQEKVGLGIINEGVALDMNKHSGESYAKAAADSAVTHRNIQDMNTLLGVEILRTPEMKQYISDNGYEEEASKINKAFVNSPEDPNMEELSDFLTGREKLTYIKSMLAGMKQDSTIGKKDSMNAFRNLSAKISDSETKWSDISSNVNSAQRELLAKMKSEGFIDSDLKEYESTLEAKKTLKQLQEDMALMPDHMVMREINKADDDIKNKMGDFSFVAKGAFRGAALNLHRKNQMELANAPADYVVKHSKSAQFSWSKVSLNNPKDINKATDVTELLQKNLRVPPHARKLAPKAIVESFSAGLNSAMQEQGSITATKYIIGLQASMGDKLPKFLNELADSGKLEFKELAVTSWIKDPVLLQENLGNLMQMKDNIKSYDRKNGALDTKIKADDLFLKAADGDMNTLVQVNTKNGIRRRESLETLVKARFYKDMADKELKTGMAIEMMKKAYSETIKKIYTKSEFGKSSAMIPNSYNLDQPTVKAGMKLMKREGQAQILAGQVDFDRIPQIRDKYRNRGYSPQRMNEAFLSDYGNKLRVLHPPSDSNEGVLRLYFENSGRKTVVPFKATGDNPSPVKEYFLKDLNEDSNIIQQKEEDAKSFFSFGE